MSTRHHQIMPQDFEFMKIIGKGSFGKVYLAKHKSEQKIYAVKVINKQMILKHNEKRHVMSERNVLLQNLRHPFLVAMHYSFQSRDKLYFVLDYANGGEMFYHLSKERVFDENRARFYAAEITLALGYLHSEGIVYRDLKPENILLDASGHLMLTDFGLCKEGLHDSFDTTTTFCGTPEYLAPEVIRKQPYDRCVDWWCLGAVLFEMLFGLPPFFSRDRAEMYDNILHQPLRFRHACSTQARNILENLLSKDKQTRLGFVCDAHEVKAHEFFKSIHWPSLEAKQIKPPYNPRVTDSMDVQNIDPVFIGEQITSSVWRQTPPNITNNQLNNNQHQHTNQHLNQNQHNNLNYHNNNITNNNNNQLAANGNMANGLDGCNATGNAENLSSCNASNASSQGVLSYVDSFRGFSYVPPLTAHNSNF